ncbi:MAG: hypothetical protein JW720_14045 [Sedimentisphaerales bacterium]|nr:hypothetical protein [Sedimentisphaerales bacterium]
MFTIDLLKGEGLPEKTKAGSMAVVAAATAIPMVVAIAMFGIYLHNRITVSIQSRAAVRYKNRALDLSDAVAKQKALERDKAAYGVCLSEVRDAIGRHTQWSGIMATLVEEMPKSVVLTALEVKERSIRLKVPIKEDPARTRDVTVSAPVLRMDVVATPQSDVDKDIRDFKDSLLASAAVGPKLENITFNQRADTLNGLEVVSYEINCLFKPKL